MLKKPTAKPGYVCMGVIVGAHGIRGHIKLKSFAQNPTDITAYGPLVTAKDTPFTLKNPRPAARNTVIAQAQGLTNRNQAEALIGTELFVKESAIPTQDDEVLYSNLLNQDVLDHTQTKIGTVINVFSNGAQDVLEIQSEDKSILIPFVEDFIETLNPLTLTQSAQDFWDL